MPNGQFNVNAIDVAAGLLIIIGGAAVIFGYVNYGLLVTGIGSVVEAVKIFVQQGPK